MSTMNKQALSVTSLHDKCDDGLYWLSKTPVERLRAIEQMRQVIYGYQPATQRLQRILEVTELTPR